MSGPARRGAAPVGEVGQLPPVELATVLCLRLWCAGASAQAELCGAAARTLGPGPGIQWTEAFADFLGLIGRFARRPLVRHALGCRCLGADESAVATLVAAAAAGEREDAMLIGMLIVRPDMAVGLAQLAETVGLGLSRMSLVAGAAGAEPSWVHATRH